MGQPFLLLFKRTAIGEYRESQVRFQTNVVKGQVELEVDVEVEVGVGAVLYGVVWMWLILEYVAERGGEKGISTCVQTSRGGRGRGRGRG